ncbi:MAG: hypothetical protein EOO12_01470 [Chitinophagaceae bacterium]|nr:MAG: hypothetical protein EOO12_01470 [Chitinophagaceae bacterium]
MNKYFLSFVILLLSCCVRAQTGTAVNVPGVVRAAFQKAYPGVAGNWEKEGRAYEVEFKKGGKAMSCVINSRGTIVETETEIRPGHLPAAARSYLQAHYPGQAVKEAARIVKAGGLLEFEANVGAMDVLFDANGNFIRTVKD